MTSFVIASADASKRNNYIVSYCQELNIDEFDVTRIGKDTSLKTTTSIGINEIKNLHAKIFLKPIKSPFKAIILEDAELLTAEAQNALLKVLEEPPEHTIIVLSTETIETLLPTIISRCQIIQLGEDNTQLTDGEKVEFIDFINNLTGMKIGARLKKAEELAKDKDEAIIWIGKLIFVLRDKLLKLDANDINKIHHIKSFQKLHTILKTTNANPRFAIEDTLLNLNS